MAHKPVNLAASIAQKLRNAAQTRQADFQLILARYAVERLLYRVSVSPHREQFILKGAMLFTAWAGDPFRATRDVDFLGHGDPTPEAVCQVFREICTADVPDDALRFDVDALAGEAIAALDGYGGVRVKTTAYLGKIEIPVQADVGFGDTVVPDAAEIDFPVLLDAPAPRLRAYAKETVVAEKFEAMIRLGEANSRMKDFYDILALQRLFDFEGPRLAASLRATFDRRGTPLPETPPLALTNAFAALPIKAQQWTAFLNREQLIMPVGTLAETVAEIATFVMPAAQAASTGSEFSQSWPSGGPWRAA